jgi:chemotaxis methyl-accepting protein methylase
MGETMHLVQKALVTLYLSVVSRIWKRIPARLSSHPILVRYGAHLHSLVLKFADRRQNHSTFFLRNRPELELMRRLAGQLSHGSSMDIAVFACSKGAEVYSIAWTLKTARPDLTINLHAVDLSHEIIEFAKQGIYSSIQDTDVRETEDHKGVKLNWNTYRDQVGFSLFSRMSESEKNQIFDRDGDFFRVKSWIKEGVSWHCADAGDLDLVSILGRQDMVVANRFLCHMGPADAERTLRNLGLLLKPGGYLFVSGIDLDVRTRAALDAKWKPVAELMEEIHDGDPTIRTGWPFEYWAKEPFQTGRPNAIVRYASAFQIFSVCALVRSAIGVLTVVSY